MTQCVCRASDWLGEKSLFRMPAYCAAGWGRGRQIYRSGSLLLFGYVTLHDVMHSSGIIGLQPDPRACALVGVAPPD